MLLLSKLYISNLEKNDFKERIDTVIKLKVASQSDQSQRISGSQRWDFDGNWMLTCRYFEHRKCLRFGSALRWNFSGKVLCAFITDRHNALCDLVSVQKNVKTIHIGVILLVNLFFRFFELHKWYQIAQNVTY